MRDGPPHGLSIALHRSLPLLSLRRTPPFSFGRNMLHLLLAPQIPWPALVSYDRTPLQSLPHHLPHPLAHAKPDARITAPIAIQIPFAWNASKRASGAEQATGVDEDGKDEGEDVDRTDDDDVVELAGLEGLVDVIARSNEDEGGEDEGEEGECCGVEDAEDGDVPVQDVCHLKGCIW